MLAAIGMTPRQVRRMARHESLVTSLLARDRRSSERCCQGGPSGPEMIGHQIASGAQIERNPR